MSIQYVYVITQDLRADISESLQAVFLLRGVAPKGRSPKGMVTCKSDISRAGVLITNLFLVEAILVTCARGRSGKMDAPAEPV